MSERLCDHSDYFDWLCEIVCVDGRYADESYWILAEALWDIDYYWILDMDETRAKSVETLRYRYINEGGRPRYTGKASVLEVLVMMAESMYDLLDELDGEDQRPIYFWEMIDNLGLIGYSDRFFKEIGDKRPIFERRIVKKVRIWLDRAFEYDGKGSIFPLMEPKEDQRNVDLWYQMQAYLIERY